MVQQAVYDLIITILNDEYYKLHAWGIMSYLFFPTVTLNIIINYDLQVMFHYNKVFGLN